MFGDKELKAKSIEIMRRMGVDEECIEKYKYCDIVPQFVDGGLTYEGEYDYIPDNYLVQLYCKIDCHPYVATVDTIYGYKMVNFLYISPYREDFDFMCRQGPNANTFIVYAYCYNVDRPELSESGSILIEIKDGCIRRIG